jgi:hypothetical protein
MKTQVATETTTFTRAHDCGSGVRNLLVMAGRALHLFLFCFCCCFCCFWYFIIIIIFFFFGGEPAIQEKKKKKRRNGIEHTQTKQLFNHGVITRGSFVANSGCPSVVFAGITSRPAFFLI